MKAAQYEEPALKRPSQIAPLQERGAKAHGKVTWYVIMTAVVASSGGLMFGYDNGVTGGVTGMHHFLRIFFPTVARAVAAPGANDSAYCKYDSQGLQAFTSVLFLAGMLAAIPAAWVTTKKGRKVSMLVASSCYIVGIIIVTAAVHISMLIIGRILLGVGVGFAIQACTLFNSEMAPSHLRGALNILFQLSVTIGILAAQLINYGTQHFYWGWRVSLGCAIIPAIILFIGSLTLPESPNSLIERGHYEEARRVLRRTRGVQDVELEFEDIYQGAQAASLVKNPWRTLLERRFRPQLVITILMPFFQQFTGINAIIFYSPVLFSSLGSSQTTSLLSTVIVGAVNVLSTLVAVFGVDRFGRRILLLQAGVQMFCAEVVVGVLLAKYYGSSANASDKLPHHIAILVIVFICIFIASFAWSWGPLGWLVPSEIHPLETRSAGQSLNVVVNLLFTFVIGQSFLAMLCGMKFGVFLFFAGMVVIMTVFTYFFIPETKGLLIEDVHEVFASHWFWKRIGPTLHPKDVEARVEQRRSVTPGAGVVAPIDSVTLPPKTVLTTH